MSPTLGMLLFLLVGLTLGIFFGWVARDNALRKSDRNGRPSDLSDSSRDIIAKEFAPLEAAMGDLNQKIHSYEVERAESLSALSAQVQSMARTSALLYDRTDKLVTALRAPQVRGRWGEMQLERVVEMSGMVKFCDFDTQVAVRRADRVLKPDMIVRLAGGKQIIVDAKAPVVAYLDALSTTDPEEHAAHLRRHANHLRTHITQLSAKDYINAFQPTPEFVVLFVPADPFLDAALTTDSELLEFAFSRNVILATPTTLVALLRTVALGWQQEAVNDQAATIHQLGRELYTRLNTMADHYNRVGSHLEKAVEAYNATLNSIDSRVMVTARKLHELDVPRHTNSRPTTLDPAVLQPRKAVGDTQ